MCLSSATLKPVKETTGYAIKVVNSTDKPDEFVPYYPYFDKYGNGGRGYSALQRNPKSLIPAKVVYKIGRTYRVKHNRMARAGGKIYPALVHCYVNLHRASVDHGMPTGRHIFILVKYSGAQYTDGHSLTAKYVTPLVKIDNSTMFYKFKNLIKEKGFQVAAEILFTASQFFPQEVK